MPLLNPFNPTICPFCFNPCHMADCDVVSSINYDANGAPLVLNPAPTGFNHTIARFYVKPLAGTKYISELARRRCANCQELLPPNIEYMDNRIIAIVGGKASGKSHYIASLINALERGPERVAVNCIEFMPANQEVARRYEQDFYKPFFEQHIPLDPNTQVLKQGDLKPLVYSMTFGTNTNGQQKRVNLVFFDGAGEDIQNQEYLARYYQYILHASAIIFLIDPWTIPGILNQLPAHLRPAQVQGHEAFRVLNGVITVFRQFKGLQPGEKIRGIPASITIAKSDLLKYVIAGLGQKSAILQEPNYADGFQASDFMAVSDEVEELLNQVAGPTLLQPSHMFKTRAFSAVSATGGPPDTSGKYPHIAPRRCLDPLFWVLWKLGLIDGNNAEI